MAGLVVDESGDKLGDRLGAKLGGKLGAKLGGRLGGKLGHLLRKPRNLVVIALRSKAGYYDIFRTIWARVLC